MIATYARKTHQFVQLLPRERRQRIFMHTSWDASRHQNSTTINILSHNPRFLSPSSHNAKMTTQPQFCCSSSAHAQLLPSDCPHSKRVTVFLTALHRMFCMQPPATPLFPLFHVNEIIGHFLIELEMIPGDRNFNRRFRQTYFALLPEKGPRELDKVPEECFGLVQ